jgi:protein required for attachment to host cells
MDRKLVIVADAARAYFAVGEQKRLHRIILEMNNEDLGTHEPDPKRNGRTIGGFNFYDPHTDAKESESQAFVKKIIDTLNHFMQEQHYESLILVATPKMLGLIRKKLNPHWNIAHSLALEATQMSLQELEEKVFG